jgi:DNA-binding CsgD family transcriptional regulator
MSRLRAVAADASRADTFASRTLATLRTVVDFDEGHLFAVDSRSLLLTELLAYQGDNLGRLAGWLRDVYLVGEPADDAVTILALLRSRGGPIALHERLDRCFGVESPGIGQRSWQRHWRRLNSPPGGGVRMCIAHRRQWVGVLQLSRWQAGPGFAPHDLELLQLARPTIGAGLAARVLPLTDTAPGPGRGHLLFDRDRLLTHLDEPGRDWLARLRSRAIPASELAVPVAVQSAVSYAARYGAKIGVQLTDTRRRRVLVTASREIGPRAERHRGVFVTIESGPAAWNDPLAQRLTPRQQEIATLVATGLSDRAIAERLVLSPATVHGHLARLHALAETSTRPALAARLAAASLFE